MDSIPEHEPFSLDGEPRLDAADPGRAQSKSHRFTLRDRDGRTTLELPLWLALLLLVSAPQLALVVYVIVLARGGSLAVEQVA